MECIGNSKIGVPQESASLLPRTKFQVGDTVLHGVFGEGKIVAVDEKSQTYEILFEELSQTRRIQFRAKLIKF